KLDNISVTFTFDASISTTKMAKVTLDTGHSSDTAINDVELYAMNPGTDLVVKTEDGLNYVGVNSTTAGTTTTINSGTGTDAVHIAPLSQAPYRRSLDLIPGNVTVNGNGATTVTIYDQFVPSLDSAPQYFITSGNVFRTLLEVGPQGTPIPAPASITYSGL